LESCGKLIYFKLLLSLQKLDYGSIALRAGAVTYYVLYKSNTLAASPLYKAKGAFFLSTS